MASKNVTNNFDRTLNVAGVDVRPGATVRVDNWERKGRASIIQQWHNAKIITISDAKESGKTDAPAIPGMVPSSGGAPAIPGMTGLPGVGDDEMAKKEAIIKELATFGIERTTKSGLDSLEKQLAEAKEKAGK